MGECSGGAHHNPNLLPQPTPPTYTPNLLQCVAQQKQGKEKQQ